MSTHIWIKISHEKKHFVVLPTCFVLHYILAFMTRACKDHRHLVETDIFGPRPRHGSTARWMHLPPVLVTSIGHRCTWQHCVDIPRFYRFCWRQRWLGLRFLSASGQWKSEHIFADRSYYFFCIGSTKNARFVVCLLLAQKICHSLVGCWVGNTNTYDKPTMAGYRRVLWLQPKQWSQGPIPSHPIPCFTLFYQIFLLTTVVVYLLGSSPDQISSQKIQQPELPFLQW